LIQLGARGLAIVAAVARGSVACNRRDDAACDLANSVVAEIGDIQIVRRVHGDAPRPVQLGTGGWAVITAEALGSISSHDSQAPRRSVKSQDDVLIVIPDEDVARFIDRARGGAIKAGGRSRDIRRKVPPANVDIV